MRKKLKQYHHLTQEKDGKVKVFFFESLQGLSIVHSFVKEEAFSKKNENNLEARLGVELLLAREMTLTGHLGGSLLPAADLPSGDRIRRLDFRHTVTGRHLTIRAGHEFGFSLLPWSELSLADAAERGTAPAEESVRYLYLDFRDARYGKPVRGGVYRATLFFCGDQPPPLSSAIPAV